MQKFNTLKSVPAYLPIVNIDTDMIIPKQFLKTIKRTGLGKNLFFEMRYDDQGKEISDFVLNQNPYNGSKILIAGKKFWMWIFQRTRSLGTIRFWDNLCN
uniref:3-isopropylmalate dehydratase n=1 Tax=uncultured marine bacterium MedDCM-OCT-S08-C1068 TaxID=743068 RepID=D6PJI1_9BACT|nr:hypothetical protein [uncultured marine bacterium MedDCM-OCT-S08-C1068]